jgi:beta-lactamase class A
VIADQKLLADFEKTEGIRLGIYLKNLSTNTTFKWRFDETFETSSTIKIPIMYFGLQKAAQNDFVDLTKQLTIANDDMHQGSGIVYWTDWKSLSLFQHLKLIAQYSDCVTTNVVVRYIGGPHILNTLLQAHDAKQTRLLMNPLNFDTDTSVMQHVGSTTPYQMAELFYKSYMAQGRLGQEFKNLTSEVTTSFFQEGLAYNGITPYKIWHKTGSMFDCDKNGDTAFNAVGVLDEPDGTSTLFSLYSRGNMQQPHQTTKTTQELYAAKITKLFWQLYMTHINTVQTLYA